MRPSTTGIRGLGLKLWSETGTSFPSPCPLVAHATSPSPSSDSSLPNHRISLTSSRDISTHWIRLLYSSFGCSLSLSAYAPAPPLWPFILACYRRVPYPLTLAPSYPLRHLMHFPIFLERYLPCPSLCVRIIHSQAHTAFAFSTPPFPPPSSIFCRPCLLIFPTAVETIPLTTPIPSVHLTISYLCFGFCGSKVYLGAIVFCNCIHTRILTTCTSTLCFLLRLSSRFLIHAFVIPLHISTQPHVYTDLPTGERVHVKRRME